MFYGDTSKMLQMLAIINEISHRIGDLNYHGSATYYSDTRIGSLDTLRADLEEMYRYEKQAQREGGYY